MNDTTGQTGNPTGLPELSDETVKRIENAVFADIATERRAGAAAQKSRRARRGRWWIAGSSAAAVVIVAAVIAPAVGNVVGGPSGGSDSQSDGGFVTTEVWDGAESAPVELMPGTAADETVGDARGEGLQIVGEPDREVIATATATLEVAAGDRASREATDAIAAAAVASGGYVESLSIGGAAGVRVDETGTTLPYPDSGTRITVRVPSDALASTIAELDEIGTVTASQTSSQDVTTEAVDLRARVESAQASVDRLTELMSQAGSLADLLAAESALAERQAELESWQQQLEYLDAQVAMSSLTVSVVVPSDPVEADPAGFGDGLAAGWNGLVATLNGIVIALGFLLPWLVVAAVVWLLVWLTLRVVRRRRHVSPDAD